MQQAKVLIKSLQDVFEKLYKVIPYLFAVACTGYSCAGQIIQKRFIRNPGRIYRMDVPVPGCRRK
jgi:Ni,Fe-hydrogenase III small subunit